MQRISAIIVPNPKCRILVMKTAQARVPVLLKPTFSARLAHHSKSPIAWSHRFRGGLRCLVPGGTGMGMDVSNEPNFIARGSEFQNQSERKRLIGAGDYVGDIRGRD